MRSELATRADTKRRLMSIPVLKLPPSKLEPSLTAVVSAQEQLREQVISAVKHDVYQSYASCPDFKKRIFRALIAPVLTRLHFARSEPPYFRPAPNARLWNILPVELKPAYASAVLYDFALIKLLLSENMIPPRGSLRETAHNFGKQLVDRVRGLDTMLKFYSLKRGVGLGSNISFITTEQLVDKHLIADLIRQSLPKGRILGIDEARYLAMRSLQTQGKLTTSFGIDETLKAAAREGLVTPLKASYARIDSLLMHGVAFGAISVSQVN